MKAPAQGGRQYLFVLRLIGLLHLHRGRGAIVVAFGGALVRAVEAALQQGQAQGQASVGSESHDDLRD